MNDFTFYFRYGWDHIISTAALDHLIFIIALTAVYSARTWKQVVILVTAFTIGHSLTLALSVYDIIRFNGRWVEFLIPVTIVLTSIANLFRKEQDSSFKLNYILAVFFGLIHGMGFANSIRFMLAKSQSIGWPLLSFNIGLEAGQLIVVLIMMGLSYMLVDIAGIKRKWWIWLLSGTAFFISLYMAISRWPL